VANLLYIRETCVETIGGITFDPSIHYSRRNYFPDFLTEEQNINRKSSRLRDSKMLRISMFENN